MTSDSKSSAAGFQRSRKAGRPFGAATKTTQAQDNNSRGGNKEFTPRFQDQGPDFCRDFAQPSHVVRGNNAAPDSTKGLPQPGPAATGHRASPGRGLQGDFATRGKFTSYGNRTTSGEKHAFSVSSVQNVNRTIFVAERILGH